MNITITKKQLNKLRQLSNQIERNLDKAEKATNTAQVKQAEMEELLNDLD